MPTPNWRAPSITGQVFEDIVGTFLGHAGLEIRKVVPGRGDGGVDLYHVLEDGSLHVYQCKAFKERVSWPKIKDSLNIVSSGLWLDYRISKWTLIIPKNLTPNEIEKFRSLTAGLPFDCDYKGRLFLDRCATEFPYVLDYFTDFGKRKIHRLFPLETAIERLNLEVPPDPVQILDKIRVLQSKMNDLHPHFDFDIATGPPARAMDRQFLYAESLTMGGGDSVTLVAREKFPGSAQFCQEELTGSLVISDPDKTAEYKEVMEYGARRLIELDSKTCSATVPGVFGQLGPDFTLRLFPADGPSASKVSDLKFGQPGDVAPVFQLKLMAYHGSKGTTTTVLLPSERLALEFRTRFGDSRANFRMFDPREPGVNLVKVPPEVLLQDLPVLWGISQGVISELDRKTSEWNFVQNQPTGNQEWLLAAGATVVVNQCLDTPIPTQMEIKRGDYEDLAELALLLVGFATSRSIGCCDGRVSLTRPAEREFANPELGAMTALLQKRNLTAIELSSGHKSSFKEDVVEFQTHSQVKVVALTEPDVNGEFTMTFRGGDNACLAKRIVSPMVSAELGLDGRQQFIELDDWSTVTRVLMEKAMEICASAKHCE